MTTKEGLFSLRIVVADFYLTRPISGLDPTYSEFRAHEIKTLPVIRIFGSNTNGEKTCMHIHGVFPYFYIPYERSDGCNAEQLTYQIASSLDKAINISLGQTHSETQHVFKIQLVKAVPFYGYHSKEHQFFKIFLYNPRFIKKAANLFQNGAILGRIFQPHESHVPYVLQFFIDYNLYGMSLLHVPKEVIKYRQGDANECMPELKKEQILNQRVTRMSTSRHELDIVAPFILNRFQLLNRGLGNINPGIESIWEDERVRRTRINLVNEPEIPTLEILCSQERILAKPTESDAFYKAALRAKLLNKSLNSTRFENTARRSAFNLSKFLANSVYPSECTEDLSKTLINASTIQDNLSNDSIFHSSIRTRSKLRDSLPMVSSESHGFVNEEMVLSLSQLQSTLLSQKLLHEDLELLEVMQQLEEDDGRVDFDSTLAQLSQTTRYVVNEVDDGKFLNVSIAKEHNTTCSDDDEDLNDYTVSVGTVDQILLELSLSQNAEKNQILPQIDGADDSHSTPKKRRGSKINSKVKNSPHTPKVASTSKYAPLNITVKKPLSRVTRNLYKGDRNCTTNSCASNDVNLELNGKKLRLKRVLVNLNNELNTVSSNETNVASGAIKTLSTRSNVQKVAEQNFQTAEVESKFSDTIMEHCPKKCKLKIKRLKIKHILINSFKEPIGALEPAFQTSPHNSTAHNSQNLKVSGDSNSIELSEDKLNLKPFVIHDNGSFPQFNNEHKLFKQIEGGSIEKTEKQLDEKNKKSTKDHPTNSILHVVSSDEMVMDSSVAKITRNDTCTTRPEIHAIEIKSETQWRKKSWSPCDISREYDRMHNFYPEPGPSGIQKKWKNNAKFLLTPAESTSAIRTRSSIKLAALEPLELDSEEVAPNENSILSFYEKSFIVGSPSLFSDSSTRNPPFKCGIGPFTSNESQSQSILPSSIPELIVITTKDLPPSFDQVEEKMTDFDIPDKFYPEPFYEDDDDVIGKREVGHMVLCIPGKSLNACENFESLLPNLKGINTWRQNTLCSIFGVSIDKNVQTIAIIKEYFANQKRIVISTTDIPPTKIDAKRWLQDQIFIKNPQNSKRNIENSPIEVKREEIKMIFNESINIEDSDCDLTQKCITLSPFTHDKVKSEVDIKRLVPNKKNQLNDHAQLTPTSALQKLNERGKSRARLSLSKKFERHHAQDLINAKANSSRQLKRTKSNTNIQCIPIINLLEVSEDSEKVSDHSSIGSDQTIDLCSDKVRQILERTSFIKNLAITDAGHDISFGLSGVSPNKTFGFKISLENLQKVKTDVEYNYLTVFSMEVYVKTRDHLKPDPEHDPIECIFFSIINNAPENPEYPIKSSGCIMIRDERSNPSLNGVKIRIIVVKTEMELFDQLLQLCRCWDPDILAGYEIEMNSWGYLIDRAQVLGMNLKVLLSRIPTQKVQTFANAEREQFSDFDIELKLCGRILLDVWRLMRSEIALTSYTYENVVYHILHRRCPLHSFSDLTKWYSASNTRWIVMEYYMERVNGTLQLLDQLDLIGRTSEMAKLIGIQFYEVLSRGSQFRVESMMLRIAKPKNFIPLSPSIQQRAHMRAPEYLPLILEPQSRFYSDPMIVLDFQSLYPSMIIAYNYCFSTCLGRVEHLGQSTPFEFGASQLRISQTELNRLIENDLITISPCGVVFVKKQVREGILPRMLKEILDTRLMVKKSMKVHKNNSTLQRVLHSRQLGLKLMANVTYGYTAANFSGRMPSVEVGDSVVGKGRETLERAIKLVESNEEWRAKVVYGDTDSMFVLVAGRSRTDAFEIGEEIAEAVTNDNPLPVKLKLEKVYNPCILQTKKRYVGYMYESADQENPVYEAKGIETVRRDGCPAVAKMLEKCLRILFETCDVSDIKRYVCRQFTKLLTGNANVQDLIFAKEFRGKYGYKAGACVPALAMTRKWLQTDPRNEPRCGERVPYLIVNGPPGVPLIRLVRSPHEFLADDGLKINAIYYITKAIIPPLNRCLLLIGANVNEWFADLPRKYLAMPVIPTIAQEKLNNPISKKSTISQYFSSMNCIIDCGRHTNAGICNQCVQNSLKCTTVLSQKISKLERSYFLTKKICQSCCGRLSNFNCRSLDCPVLFVTNLKDGEQTQAQCLREIICDKFS